MLRSQSNKGGRSKVFANELIKYLQQFPPESEVAFVAADIKARKKYNTEVFGIIDQDIPVICIGLKDGTPFDDEEVQAAEEYEEGNK